MACRIGAVAAEIPADEVNAPLGGRPGMALLVKETAARYAYANFIPAQRGDRR
ncbi:hypothetical protein IHE49_00710 [Rhodanobacter sp. 7MK24]|uniref:hypothetical protein n=1 Tax=Rhodanobacter sp. 7MK24 TaxID=2775922 RepID=UPI00177B9742|nr:hypothetical protein [Rhodanobacter sp. 7MK24]MBD8878994.1 hypothetical protein [Rhodanobacter sp. 7MK24]